jgi:TonB family protein
MLDSGLHQRTAPRTPRLALAGVLIGMGVAIGGFAVDAQTFATFTGSVLDPTSREIPAVTVVLTNAQSRAKYQIRSDESGRFEFVGLPAGEYLVEAEYPGFKRFQADLIVGAENVQRNLRLTVGSLSEHVSVQGSRDPGRVAPPARAQARRPIERRPATDCEPSATGGNIRPPMKVRNVAPVYPSHLGAEGVSGTVMLDATIGTDGTVRDVSVVGQAHPDLAASAIEAVRQWEFTETLLNCVPIDVAMRVSVRFDVE